MPLNLKKEIRYLKGVGEVRASNLKRIGIESISDLVTYYPCSYEDRRKIHTIAMLKDSEVALIKGIVIENREAKLRGNRKLVTIKVTDETGIVKLLGFNQPYLKNILKVGCTIFIHGKFSVNRWGIETSNFTYELVDTDTEEELLIHMGRVVPVYSLTSGITQKWLRKLIFDTMAEFDEEFTEYIPSYILKKENLDDINSAIKNIHFPGKIRDAERARKRMIMDEFLLFQTALALRNTTIKNAVKERKYTIKKNFLTPFKQKLGFDFTVDQKKAINDIFNDLISEFPMKRLLQGEVGSGKTVVALSAVLLVVENAYLGVVIAPTEILAEQHYLTFKSYLEGMGIKIELLTGKLKKKERNRIINNLESGKVDIIVGTHALFQDDINLSRAGIVVIDEQHRFGVKQKELLINKSEFIDVLSMSATPIPRTMAMCNYGDLDVSTIRELPSDRKVPVTKYARKESEAYSFALKELEKENLVYIVHPLIEESDSVEWKSAEERFRELSCTVFKDYKCALLHGRMSGDNKEAVMHDFSSGKVQVLFTTTVVEVGINISRATVMIIENFDRYGLSSLHQLRGRIARSSRQPYCFLTGNAFTPESKRRLKIMLSTTDGFKIAEEDLKLRGAGELFGTRQHGIINFKIGDPIMNFDLLSKSREYAFSIVNSDADVYRKGHTKLKAEAFNKYKHTFHLADIS